MDYDYRKKSLWIIVYGVTSTIVTNVNLIVPF